MILSDRELRAALNRGALRITPDPPAEAWIPPVERPGEAKDGAKNFPKKSPRRTGGLARTLKRPVCPAIMAGKSALAE